MDPRTAELHVMTAGADDLAALLKAHPQQKAQDRNKDDVDAEPVVRRLYTSRIGLRALGVPSPVPCILSSRWPSLVEVDLSGNLLQTLPSGLGSLRCLRKLYLQYNKLSALPADLCAYGSGIDLRELWVDHNELTELPRDWSGAQQLVSFHCAWNRLTSLPASLVKSRPRLTELLCQNNELRSLPACLGPGLPALRCLALRANHLTELPASLGDAPSLVRLLAGSNPLGTSGGIPFALGLCPMSELYLAACELRVLPEALQLYGRTLRWIDISDNMLETLPGWVEELHALQWIDADHNRFATFQQGVARRLAQLVGLSLAGNPIEKQLGLDGLDPKATTRAMRQIDWESQPCSRVHEHGPLSRSWASLAAEQMWLEWRAWRICCGRARIWVDRTQMVHVPMPRSAFVFLCCMVVAGPLGLLLVFMYVRGR